MLQQLVPDVQAALSFTATLLTALALAALGRGAARLVGDRRPMPEADALVGWGLATALIVAMGTLTDIGMTPTLATLALAALASAVMARRDLLAPPVVKLLILAVPLLLLTAAMHPSQWDEFGQWLPNARYLVTHDQFPAQGRPLSDSIFPAYPYAVPLLILGASRIAGTLADMAAGQINLLLLVVFAATLARQYAVGRGGPVVFGWRGLSLALLAATIASPTFVPKLVLSAYADTATGLALAVAALAGLAVVNDDPTTGRRGALLQLASALILLLQAKQANLALAGLVVGGLTLLATMERPRGDRFRTAALILATALPALLLHLLWRHHVAQHLPGGEKVALDISHWRWDLLPDTLANMGHVAAQKIGYFGLSLLISVIGLVLWARRRHRPLARAFLLYAMLFLGYQAFLIAAYVGVLAAGSEHEARSAQSYWRYNTHLGPLLSALAAQAAGALAAGRTIPAKWRAHIGASAVVLAIVLPLAAWRQIRFDLDPAKRADYPVAAEMDRRLPADARLVVIDAHGDGFHAIHLRYLMGAHRRLLATIDQTSPDTQAACRQVVNGGETSHLWLRSWTPAVLTCLGLGELERDRSYLLTHDDGGNWRIERSWASPLGWK